jgi:hypothetical protein
MMAINSTLESPSESALDMAPASPQIASLMECREYLEQLVDDIGSTRVRRIVGAVFQDLLRLLECLSILEGHLRHVQTAEETLAFFQLIRDEAKSLIEFIRDDAMNCSEVSGELADTLDGLVFALSHDLRRVFEGEYETTADNSPYVVLGRVHRAHDVLTNCLQQSIISLAVVYTPTLSITQLFNNTEKRYRQSLKLCSDLECLRQVVQRFVDGRAASTELSAGLETFRRESLEFLMYSDWPQFESFCERILLSADDPSTLADVLHQFLCYVETLIRQVKMRAVLADESNLTFDQLSPANSNYQEKLQLPLQTGTPWAEFAFPV